MNKIKEMQLNKKSILLVSACFFVAVSGIFYSCAFSKQTSRLVLQADLAEANGEAVKDPNKETQGSVSDKIPEQAYEDTTLSSKLSSDKQSENGRTGEQETEVVQASQSKEEDKIYIHICGAVVNPGIYEAESDARIFQLINQAGGLTNEAAGDAINQAQLVQDGERIYIPTKEEVKANPGLEYRSGGTEPRGTSQTGSQKININTAGPELLMELPGVGEAKAQSIIKYREEYGAFQKPEDLMKIPGIKEGLYNKVADFITTQ